VTPLSAGEGYIQSIPAGMSLSSEVIAITHCVPHSCLGLAPKPNEGNEGGEGESKTSDMSLRCAKHERSLTSSQLAEALRPQYELSRRAGKPWMMATCRHVGTPPRLRCCT
jgi:hypothetical protein